METLDYNQSYLKSVNNVKTSLFSCLSRRGGLFVLRRSRSSYHRLSTARGHAEQADAEHRPQGLPGQQRRRLVNKTHQPAAPPPGCLGLCPLLFYLFSILPISQGSHIAGITVSLSWYQKKKKIIIMVKLCFLK